MRVALPQFQDPPRLGGIKPWPQHDPIADAKVLRKAMRGLGTDERKIIDIIATRTNAQRVSIAIAYQVCGGVGKNAPFISRLVSPPPTRVAFV